MNKSTLGTSSILLGLGLILSGCGNQSTSTPVGTIQSITSRPDQLTSDNAQFQKGVMEVQSDTLLNVKTDINGLPKKLLIKKGDSFNILKVSTDKFGHKYAQILLDDENESEELNVPYFVLVSELKELKNLSLADLDDPYDDNGDDVVANDDESLSDNEILLAKRKQKKKKKKKAMTYCYRFVKMRLIQLDLVESKLPGGSAYMAADELPKHGFSKVERTPASAIANDVCVYRGGTGGHGHIEIRVKGGWWYGYGTKTHPISLKNRSLIACYHK